MAATGFGFAVVHGFWPLLLITFVGTLNPSGGLVVNALLALWLYERFGLSVSTTGAIFFATKLCSAVSYFLAIPLARRFGLVNTMVFTHLPANIFRRPA
jgi:hypothetical protein